MAALCPPVKFQAFDNNGDPAVGYKLHTYETGTTTNKETYTDSDGAVPNANPVIFDARGEITLYLIPGELYRIVLKTDADVTIWTQDGVSASVHTAGGGIEISTAGAISVGASAAGAGLTVSAGVLAVGAGTGIVVNANDVAIDAATTAQVYSETANKVLTADNLPGLIMAANCNGDASPSILASYGPALSISQSATGVFIVTHNLALGDTRNMAVIAIASNTSARHCTTTSQANTVTVYIWDAAGAAADSDFYLAMFRLGT